MFTLSYWRESDRCGMKRRSKVSSYLRQSSTSGRALRRRQRKRRFASVVNSNNTTTNENRHLYSIIPCGRRGRRGGW